MRCDRHVASRRIDDTDLADGVRRGCLCLEKPLHMQMQRRQPLLEEACEAG